MKLRYGFVSNSSSSSFIIGVKNGKLTKEKLLTLFNLPKQNILYSIVEDMGDLFMSTEKYTERQFLDEYGYESLKDAGKEYEKIYKKCKEVYVGTVCNDSDNPVETMLYDLELNYEDNEIIIIKERC